MTVWTKCVLGALMIVGCITCTTPEAEEWSGAVRDSAGVVIVENDVSAASAGSAWRVSPDLTFGSIEGDDEFVFARIADVGVDRQGQIYVLDQQAREVRVFDSSGAYVRTIGRGGEGPGELSGFTSDVLISDVDTVYVPDYAQARINAYGPDGLNTIAVPALPAGRNWVFLGEGRFLYRGVTISRDEMGRFQAWDALMQFDATNEQLDTVLAFDYEQTELGTREAIRIPLIVNTPSWTRLDDGRVVWSSLDRTWIQIHDSTGALARIVHSGSWQPRELTSGHRAVMVELLREKLEMIGGDPSAADMPTVDVPESLPAITGVRAGPHGTIWVQRMGEPERIDPMAINASDRSEWLGGSVWDVLDGSGRLLGSVEMPPRFRVTRITDNAVYGISKDEADDVERVMRLTLERGPA